MQLKSNTSELPDFIIKSTFGVAFVSIVLLTPYGINNLVQGRIVLGILTLLIALFCVISAWTCYKGRYHLGINLFGIAPAITITIILATYDLGVRGSYWAFLVVLGLYLILPLRWAWIFSVLFLVIIIPISMIVMDYPIAMRFASVLLGTNFFAYLAIREITEQHNKIKAEAITDTLTGLYNRSILKYSLDHAIQINRRTNAEAALMMVDIDHFKKINDKFGHDVGDSVLKALGKMLKNHFRGSDIVFRIGGEEFLVVVYNTDSSGVFALAEQLRMKVEKSPIIPGQSITISIGVAKVQDDITGAEWMKICDEKLYCAKSNGRNRVVI